MFGVETAAGAVCGHDLDLERRSEAHRHGLAENDG